jgi:lysophospholipid hydrolase
MMLHVLIVQKNTPFPMTSEVEIQNSVVPQRFAVFLFFSSQEVKNSDYCEYIRPPIDKYKTLQFGSFDEIKVCLSLRNSNCCFIFY